MSKQPDTHAGMPATVGAAEEIPTSVQGAHEPAPPFMTIQPSDQWLARVLLGSHAQDASGHHVGDINDLLFDRTGRISTVVLGVGGMLGLGEKNVAIPFGSLSFEQGDSDGRIVVVGVDKQALAQAPPFIAVEKTTFDVVRDRAVDIGQRMSEKAIELQDQAARKIVNLAKSRS